MGDGEQEKMDVTTGIVVAAMPVPSIPAVTLVIFSRRPPNQGECHDFDVVLLANPGLSQHNSPLVHLLIPSYNTPILDALRAHGCHRSCHMQILALGVVVTLVVEDVIRHGVAILQLYYILV